MVAAAGAGRAAAGAAGAKSMRRVGALDEATVGAPSSSDRARAARADRARDRAYQQGRRDARARAKDRGAFRRSRPDWTQSSAELQELYDQGFGAGRRDARRERVAAPAAKAGELVDEGSGFLLGLIGFALVLAYINHGWPGVRSWIAAKFINKPNEQLRTVTRSTEPEIGRPRPPVPPLPPLFEIPPGGIR